MSDIDDLLAAETEELAAVLVELDGPGWNVPSPCTDWRIRDVVAHLLMPYELSVPGFLVRMATTRFSFDRVADRWATHDGRSGEELTERLRVTSTQRFNVPGAPPEASSPPGFRLHTQQDLGADGLRIWATRRPGPSTLVTRSKWCEPSTISSMTVHTS